MEAKKTSSKQVVAILLLVIGLIAGVFGILGLVGGGAAWILMRPATEL